MSPSKAARRSKDRLDAAGSQFRMLELAQSLPLALLSTRESVMLHFRPLLRKHDLTEQQWRVIRALIEQSPLQATELASRSLILAPSLSRILQNLERRKIISRKVFASDQRRMDVAITGSGRALFETIAPHSQATYEYIADSFGRKRLQHLFKTLEELRDVLDQGLPES